MTLFRSIKKDVKLVEVTSLLNRIRTPISFVFTPRNLKVEKEKFLNTHDYNPVFEYEVVKNSNNDILMQLQSIEHITDLDPRIEKFYLELIKSKSEASKLMNAVGNNLEVTKISKARFGTPSPILFRNACRVLRGNIKNYTVADKIDNQRFLGSKEISDAVEAVLKSWGLDDWGVEVSKNAAVGGTKLGIKTKVLFISPVIERTPLELRKTIVHELGTHLLRSVNGESCGYPAFTKANIPSYLDVEEGLAVWNEEKFGVMTKKSLLKRTLFTWAIEIGENMTFRELYNALLAHVQEKSAFNIAYRVKRGLGDTEMPGIFTKDIVYFRGYRRVKTKLDEDRTLYNKLYAGKINFSQATWVEEGLLAKPKLILDKDQLERVFVQIGI